MNAHRQFNNRLAIIVGVLLILFGFLIFQFFYLQIIEGKKWAKIAIAQHQCSVKTPFKRGKILATVRSPHVQENSEKYPVLVFDVLSYHLLMDTTKLPKRLHQEVASHLATFFLEESLASLFPYLMCSKIF